MPSFFPDISAALIAWSAVTVLAAIPISIIWLRNRNEYVVIERETSRLLLAGVTDLSEGESLPGHASDVSKAVTEAPLANARILLAHQPGTIDAAIATDFDLQFSGHTHGGQFPPWTYIAPLQQPYVARLHRRKKPGYA